ncbi:MAG: hypothetical protein JOZ55_10100 [Alphaproteobacteria bacterium]|nr:hypothetical protein [Alphaproteobacteria bacterium]
MTTIAVSAVNSLPPDQYWKLGLGELALESALPLIATRSIDLLFCASPSAAFAQRQADFANLVADRLGIRPLVALTLDAGDASASAALHCAFSYLQAGLGSTALVVGAAKVSDLSETDRHGLMDRTLDQEAEISAGLTFASQAGLLAKRYCRISEQDAAIFSEITAANHSAWARHAGGPAMSAAEFRRDLQVADPLVRSDFSQLLDGACSVVLERGAAASGWTIEAVSSGTDTVALWERADPLTFASVERAGASLAGGPVAQWLEIDASASVIQRLAEESLFKTTQTRADVVNIRGGSQGRGRVLGASGLYQIQDIVECNAPFANALALSVSGIGASAYATLMVRRELS